MKAKVRLFLLLCAVILVATAGTGCKNTAHGAGEDIEKMGEKIQDKTD